MTETHTLSGPAGGRRPPAGEPFGRALVGIVPAVERSRRARLFDALEAAYPVRFEGRARDEWAGVDGLLALGDAGVAAAADAEGIPCLISGGEERPPGKTQTLALAEDAVLAPALRGARLSEARADGLTVPVSSSGDVVLAAVGQSPVWIRAADRAERQYVAVTPKELDVGEALRNRLAPGRCLALLALAQFVRELTAGRRWELPATRAAFVIDDPNLRRPTYGHIDYTRLARSAAEHRYHAAIATVPLDSRLAHRYTVRLFRERRAHLSLCIHGNDHDGRELGRPRSESEGLVPVAQARRRASAFERRTGIAVDHVMVAPHEQLSEAAAAALLACGYEGFSGARPYPWIAESPDLAWLTRPTDAGPLPGWGSAELMPGGLPLLMRMDFGHPREELVLRAFLGQPVIVCGHHELLEDGTSALESVAAEINRLGEVRWSSLAGIARAAVETRRSGEVLELRMLGRRVCFDVPPGVSEVRIDTTAMCPPSRTRLLARGVGCEGVEVLAAGEARFATTHPGAVELLLDGALDPASVPPPPRRLRPLTRRLAAEWRDRARPAVRRARAPGAARAAAARSSR